MASPSTAEKPPRAVLCRECSAPVQVRRQVFCSKDCWLKWWGRTNDATREDRECPNCGGTFRVQKADDQKFCGNECRKVWQKTSLPNLVSKPCERCSKPFLAYPSQADGRFCSDECRAAGVGEQHRGFNNPNWRDLPKVEVQCPNCPNKFVTDPRSPQVYCSNKCLLDYEFGKRQGKRWEAGNRWGNSSKKAGKRADLGIYVRSSWEANYARYLNWLVEKGEILKWEYEPDTFEFVGIKRGNRFYTPDFKIWEKDGTVPYHEVKGYMDEGSATKLKRMASYHPTVKIVLIQQAEYQAIANAVARLIPNWE